VSGQPGVLTPEQAVAAATLLGARRLVPIHYGVRGMAEYVEVDGAVARMLSAARGRDVDVVVVEPGAWLDW
jgi:L-ascorbate metabolism protein UlaG (beta-lactamase superfamily)